MKIAIITEAGTNIGCGHLYRSIALAQEFISNNHEVVFYCNGNLPEKIIRENLIEINVFEIKEFESSFQNYSLAVIDVYKSSWSKYRWLTQASVIKTASVIDFAFKEHTIPTDYIFQIGFQKYGFKETIKQNENGKFFKIYSGNNFFIFRNEFKKADRIEVTKDAKRILVSMGGSDPYKLTEFVSESLIELKTPLKITIILGAGIVKERLTTINSIFSNSVHEIQILQNVTNIAKLMAENDFAIINGGNTRFELAAMGVPFISIAIDKKQNSISNYLQNEGFGLNLGLYKELSTKKVSQAISNFICQHKIREAMAIEMKKKINPNNTIIDILLNELFLSKH